MIHTCPTCQNQFEIEQPNPNRKVRSDRKCAECAIKHKRAYQKAHLARQTSEERLARLAQQREYYASRVNRDENWNSERHKRQRYGPNRARYLEQQKRASERFKENNPDRVRELTKIHNQRYREKHPITVKEHKSRYRKRKKLQTNDTVDYAAIRAFYEMADRLTRITGTKYHVDHILPISKGGLHHQDNLIVMKAELNLKKHDKHWPWLHWFNEP